MKRPRNNPILTHVDSAGRAKMVDVSAKPPVLRQATAAGAIWLQPDTIRAIAAGRVPKGEVLAVARVAGIMAAKRCGELIPLCHPLPIEGVDVSFDLPDPDAAQGNPLPLRITATARITAKTGVEMEALTAVSVAALTIYDMCKAIDKSIVIGEIRLVEKTKGLPTAGPATRKRKAR